MSMSVDAEIFAPLDPDFIRDPYSRYEVLRRDDPVHQSAAGFWVLTRYEDVAAGLRDPRLSNRPARFALVNRRNAERYVAAAVANNIIAFQDPPEHTTPRRLIASSLQTFLKARKPVVRQIADNLVAELRGARSVEFMTDFSIPFAAGCTCRVMGFPESDIPLLKRWSGLFFYLFHSIPNAEVLEQVNHALAEFRQYVHEAVEERRRRPRDDFLTVIIQASRGDYSFDQGEVVDNCMLLTADGIENPQTGLTTAVATLLRHEDQLARMQADPDLVGAAIEECLRYESPGQYQGRVALETVEIGGKSIRAGSVVLHVLAAANRDPSVFPEPDRFTIDRKGQRHLSFGTGRHACIGGMLVGMEFEAALTVLFDGTRRISVATDELEWVARAGHRWPAALPLEIHDL